MKVLETVQTSEKPDDVSKTKVFGQISEAELIRQKKL